MYHRQKVLLSLLDGFGGELTSTDFQKYLFLYTRLCEHDRSYEFVPYKFGCFSFQSYADKTKLIEQGFLEDQNDWKIAQDANSSSRKLKKSESEKIKYFVSKYRDLKGKNLIKHVYKGYPYYAINSLIAEDILDEADVKSVEKQKNKDKKWFFSTIGYEGLSIEEYINKLIKNNVHILVDVRKNPLSRKYGFSKRRLSELLGKVGISYQHIPELGIESDKRKKLVTKSDYQKLFNEYEKSVLLRQESALTELYKIYQTKKRVAITCFEECHTMCHRDRVAKAIGKIADEKFKVIHL